MPCLPLARRRHNEWDSRVVVAPSAWGNRNYCSILTIVALLIVRIMESLCSVLDGLEILTWRRMLWPCSRHIPKNDRRVRSSLHRSSTATPSTAHTKPGSSLVEVGGGRTRGLNKDSMLWLTSRAVGTPIQGCKHGISFARASVLVEAKPWA